MDKFVEEHSENKSCNIVDNENLLKYNYDRWPVHQSTYCMVLTSGRETKTKVWISSHLNKI